MKKTLILLILVFVSTSFAKATGLSSSLEETNYLKFQHQILNQNYFTQNLFTPVTPSLQKLFVDALWDLTDEEDNHEAIETLNSLSTLHYQLIEKLRVEILRLKYNHSFTLTFELQDELKTLLKNPIAEPRLILTLASYEELLLSTGHEEIIELAKNHPKYFELDNQNKELITSEVIADLFHTSPDTRNYSNGSYFNAIKLFMFCRSNRLYPCLMAMRDNKGEVVRNDDGSIWTQQALGSSVRGYASHIRNGDTPAGIFTIDSVMPYADQRISFGKFRRLILNFVPKSTQENLFKSLLPVSSYDQNWWRPSIVARDAGRNLFRVHGTGKINEDPKSSWFPFMRTNGCVAQKENTYDGVEFKDQRDLLDTIMGAMGLEAKFENETKIKGFLYIIDIDQEDAPVTAHDLYLKGIE